MGGFSYLFRMTVMIWHTLLAFFLAGFQPSISYDLEW